MKYFLTIIGLAAATLAGAQAQTILFSQDFASGGTPATYVSASPTTGQWNAISSSGAAKAWSVVSNSLQIASTGANAAYSSRTTDFSSAPAVMKYTFTFNLSSSSTALTSALDFAVGSGFGTANSSENNANTYAKFGINLTATNGFTVRDISGSANGATTFGTGAQTITWVANNSGISTTYLAPDGSTESLANDTWDLWVGSSRQLNDRAVTTAAQTITDFKFGTTGTSTFTASYDDISIQSIPEPKTWALIGIGAAFMMWNLLRRRRFED